MKYYNMIKEPEDDGKDLVCTLDENTLRIGWNNDSGVNRYDFAPNDFNWGKLVQNWPTGVTFLYERKEGYRTPDNFSNDYSFLLLSKKAIDGLQDYQGKEIQLLDVTIAEKITGEQNEKGYSVCNVINVIDVIDWKQSNYRKIYVDKEDGQGDVEYCMMIKPVFKKDELKRAYPQIFKTKGDEISVYVSEEFKDYCEREKLVGFGFYEVEQI